MGCKGALAQQADAALDQATAATGRDRDQVVKELLRLVTVDEHGRPTRWRVHRDELPAPVVAELDAFVARWLLTTDLEHGQVVIGVAHEAFLSVWAPLAAGITAASTALRARRAVEQAAAEWVKNGRQPDRLWERGQLAAALADTGARLRAGTWPRTASRRPQQSASLKPPRTAPSGKLRRLVGRQRILVADRIELSQRARNFLQASVRRDRRRRNRSTSVLSTLLVLALVAAGVAGLQQRAAAEAQRLSTARQLLVQADSALRGGDPRTALQLGEAANRIHPDSDTHAGLVTTVLSTRYSSVIDDHTDVVYAVAFARHGHMLATASWDKTVLLWDVTDPAHPRRLGDPLTGHTDPVYAVAFAPDGHTLATASTDKTVLLWDVIDPAHPHRLGDPLTGQTDTVWGVAFALDGNNLATVSLDKTALLWDLSDLKDIQARPMQRACFLTRHGLDPGQWAHYVTGLAYQETCPTS